MLLQVHGGAPTHGVGGGSAAASPTAAAAGALTVFRRPSAGASPHSSAFDLPAAPGALGYSLSPVQGSLESSLMGASTPRYPSTLPLTLPSSYTSPLHPATRAPPILSHPIQMHSRTFGSPWSVHGVLTLPALTRRLRCNRRPGRKQRTPSALLSFNAAAGCLHLCDAIAAGASLLSEQKHKLLKQCGCEQGWGWRRRGRASAARLGHRG